MWCMRLRQFNIPYVIENCHDQRKIIFRIFSKNFQFSEFYPGRIWTSPCFPNIPTTIKNFFRGFWSEISRFHNFDACFSDLHRSADLWLSIPGTVRARADRLRWSVADRRNIAQMQDIPLRRFGCPVLRHAPVMESGRTSPCVFLADMSGRVCRISERTN